MNRKLYRSRSDAMISGVCGGLGKYLEIDSTLVRLFFVLLALSNGLGVLIYMLLWIIVPHEDYTRDATLGDRARAAAQEIADHARTMGDDIRQAVHQPNPKTGLYIGVALILVGFFALLDNLHLPWLAWLDYRVIWPVLLVVAGLALLLRWRREE